MRCPTSKELLNNNNVSNNQPNIKDFNNNSNNNIIHLIIDNKIIKTHHVTLRITKYHNNITDNNTTYHKSINVHLTNNNIRKNTSTSNCSSFSPRNNNPLSQINPNFLTTFYLTYTLNPLIPPNNCP